MNEFYEQYQNLHSKTQRMVSLWNAVAEHGGTGAARGLKSLQCDRMAVRQTGFWGTLVYAGVAAMVAQGMHYLGVTQPDAIRFLIWLAVGIYGVLYCQWTGQDQTTLFFPLWIGFGAAWSSMTVPEYLVLAMGLLPWVRSAQYCRRPGFLKVAGLDLMLCYGGLAGAVWLARSAHTPLMWVVSAFCSVQGLFFLLRLDEGSSGTKSDQ